MVLEPGKRARISCHIVTKQGLLTMAHNSHSVCITPSVICMLIRGRLSISAPSLFWLWFMSSIP